MLLISLVQVVQTEMLDEKVHGKRVLVWVALLFLEKKLTGA